MAQSGDRGSHAESALREVLASYLPRRYSVGAGEVIDTSDHRSGQIDVVVANEDQPLLYGPHEPGLFFIEGVDAAGEVKMQLTSSSLDQAINSAQSFKKLQALETEGFRVMSRSDIPRFFIRRPFFIFAYESQLTLETVAERVRKRLDDDMNPGPDAVFVLERGAVLDLGDGHGSLGIMTPEGTRHSGWVIKPGEDTMFGLLAWLSMVMPRVHRMTPILPEYMIATSSVRAV